MDRKRVDDVHLQDGKQADEDNRKQNLDSPKNKSRTLPLNTCLQAAISRQL